MAVSDKATSTTTATLIVCTSLRMHPAAQEVVKADIGARRGFARSHVANVHAVEAGGALE
jgi:hypothetical protein